MWAARRATGTLKNCVARDWLATSSRSSVGIGSGTPASLVTISKCSRLHTDELSSNVFHPTQRTPARPPGAHLAQEAQMFLPLSHIFCASAPLLPHKESQMSRRKMIRPCGKANNIRRPACTCALSKGDERRLVTKKKIRFRMSP